MDDVGSSSSDDHCMPVIRGPWFHVMEPNIFNKPIPAYRHNVGPVNVEPNLSPCEYFIKFMSHENSDLFSLVENETNRYAAQSSAAGWKTLNVEELKAFLGLYLAMGIVRTPTIRSYWELADEEDVTETPFFRKVMSRNRFQSIMKYLHCNDNNTAQPRNTPGYDPLHKISPVVELLNGSFSDNYNLGQHIAIDERIVGFKGRHQLKQYISNKKRHRWGAKMWILSDSDTGYTHQVYIYKGRYTNNGVYPNGQGYHVVRTLMRPHLHKNHHLTTDRFFTSPTLFHDLYRDGTYATGTVLAGRKGIPNGLKKLRLPRNEMTVRRQGPLMAVLWADRKQVLLLSTAGTPRMTLKRNSKGRIRVAPGIVHLYNQNMGGVDLGDQLVCLYDPEFRGRKLWRKIFFNLIVTATVNAYILYKRCYLMQRKMDHLQFQIAICKGLIGQYRHGRTLQRCRDLSILLRLTERHFAAKIADGKRKQCVVCSARVGTWCEDCRVGLCSTTCFRRYHTLVNYVLPEE